MRGTGKVGRLTEGMPTNMLLVSAQIVVSGKISSEEEPSDDSLANDEEGVMVCKGNRKSGPCHHFLTTAMRLMQRYCFGQ